MVFKSRTVLGPDGGNASIAGRPPSVREAATRLLDHRHAQHGRPTLGDPEDAAFARFLASLPTPDASLVADLQWAGEALGRHVYAKPIVDEPLPRALRSLAGGLRASGLGELIIVDAFNRAALIGPPADAPAAMGAYIDGVLAGFLSECFNCEVLVTRHPDGRLEAALGGGRDVNRRARP